MANGTISLRRRDIGDGYRLEVRIDHPMEPGTRQDAQGTLIPAHYVQQLEIHRELQDESTRLALANFGPTVAKNPYFALELDAVAAGSVLRVSWLDNTGDSDSRTIQL